MIYFDLDGVLADLDSALLELCGPDLPPRSVRTAAQSEEMWRQVAHNPGFFASLAPVRGAVEMFRQVRERYGGENVAVLTGTPQAVPGASEDKRLWCRRHLGEDVAVHAVPTSDKPLFCGGAQDVLVDDSESNVSAWVRAGGTAVLFLSPEQALGELV